MKDVVDFAYTLGVRVIPEIDNPGHSKAVGYTSYFNEIVRCFN
jgi:N-acetyl-beta-hexosaminidase